MRILNLLDIKLGDTPLGVNCSTVPQFKNISRDSVLNILKPTKGPFPIPHSTSVQPFSELRFLLHTLTEPVPETSNKIQ